MQTEFDYIVVGGGSAGCAAVHQLAVSGRARVLLLEAGPGDADIRVRIPFGLVHLLGGSRDWARKTVPQAALSGRRIGVPRGKMIGGSGSINSMVWFRGREEDYDAWGIPGWSGAGVQSAFEEVEALVGPMRLPHPNVLSEAFGAVIPANDPTAPPTPDRESTGVFHVNMRKGRRWSAADAFLRPARANGDVTVLTGAEVGRVVLDGRTASGVTLRDGRRYSSMRGVVLSAGAIETPMILMRSGIGAAAELKRHGIDVVIDAPGVGANLHDHPGFGLHFTGSGQGLTLAQLPVWALSPISYAIFRRGPLASNTVEAGAFFKVRADARRPEVQSHFLPFMLGWKGRTVTWGAGFFADVCVCNPRSRGTLPLGSDRFDPAIDLGLLTDEHDLETIVLGVVRLRQILGAARLGKVIEGMPGAEVTGTALRDVIRARCGTAYHPVGTVRMGDKSAPLDAEGKVRGASQLWVADASVMPLITSTNTNAPSMMIGWRIGGAIAAHMEERIAS